jgi:hypothetical protein
MIDPSVKEFITYDYSEAKDLAKSFLTLISAILVFSITFSEKIISFQNAARRRRIFLVICWICLMVSIIGCGLSIVIYFSSLVLAAFCDSTPCNITVNGVG